MATTEILGRVGRRYRAMDMRAAALGLIPPSSHAQAFDAFTNAAARMGWGTPNLSEGVDYTLVRFSYDYMLLITLYRNHWISRRIVDQVAKDMTRAWPTIQSDIPPDDSDRLNKALRRANAKSQILTAIKWARLFGGSGCMMVIDGQENVLDKPLHMDDIEPGAFRGLIPFDRWTGVSPEGDVSVDIDKPLEFNLPTHYRVNGPRGDSFRVHASRLLRFIGPSVPSPEYQAQSWWGISSLEPAYEEIRKRDNMSWNILSLTFRASLLAMKQKDLSQMLSGASMSAGALEKFEQRMSAVNHLLSNQSLMITDADGGLDAVNYTFSGLSDVYQQFQLDIAGAAEIPVSRLFGRTITGLGQANDADERIYEERIAMEQEEGLRPQLERLYRVMAMSELGEEIDDLELKFPSIRVLTEEEKSKLSGDNATTTVALANAGLLTKPQALKEIKQQADQTGYGSNIREEDIQAAEEEEKAGFGGLGEMEAGGLPQEEAQA